ncbi:MAG: glucosyl-3-phosphoglycerate synthase [Anaerolineales bacterium]|nr:glucosyl-3-phosphoglycerate synthase [Anaerolineales bacterium]
MIAPTNLARIDDARSEAQRVMLVLEDETDLSAWVRLATALCASSGEIHLRGVITIPEGTSLSEGATRARNFREALDQVARDLPLVHDEALVTVDHHPMDRLIPEISTRQIDLVIVRWVAPDMLVGGVPVDDVLRRVPCDLVLLNRVPEESSAPVLLSLRGGPNIGLGLRVAKALAEQATITVFHAADTAQTIPNLSGIMRADPQITRTVTLISQVARGILHEAHTHKAIVMGATFRQPQFATSTTSPIFSKIFEVVTIPVAMVRAYQPEAEAFHVPRRAPKAKPAETLSVRVDRWFAENTFHSREFVDVAALVALKERQNLTISLCLPALNEEGTVGNVITTMKKALMEDFPLLDEIVLIDSQSTDQTVAIAESLGIPVYKHPDLLPEMGSYVGKGEALWKSLSVLKGDLIAWIDTDITNIHPRFVYGLLGPLLKRQAIQYVKGFYQRPLTIGDTLHAVGGGRVTELVARPLLNLFYPELSGIIQPLSGEYAGRRSALQQMPFFSGYGVETGLLIDLHERFGLEGIAQVDLEERIHYNQPLMGLSKMSFAIHQVFIARIEQRYGVELLDRANRSMKLIIHEPERFALDVAEIRDVERPPIANLNLVSV